MPPTCTPLYLHKYPRYRWTKLGADIIIAPPRCSCRDRYASTDPLRLASKTSPSLCLTSSLPHSALPIDSSAVRRQGSCVWTLPHPGKERSRESIQSHWGKSCVCLCACNRENNQTLLGPKDGLQLRTTSCTLNPWAQGTDTCMDNPLHIKAEALEWLR